MKFNKIFIATLLILTILTIGAVSASENIGTDDSSDLNILSVDDDFDEDIDDDDWDDDDWDDDDDDEEEDLYVFADVESDMIHYSEGNTIIAHVDNLSSTATGKFSIYEDDVLLATTPVSFGKASIKLSDLNFASGAIGDHELVAVYDNGITKYEKSFYFTIIDYKIIGPSKDIYLGDAAVFTISLPSTVSGRVTVYRDDDVYMGSGEVVNGVGTVTLKNMPLGSYEIEFVLNSGGYNLDEFYFLTIAPKKIKVPTTAYIGEDNIFSASLPSNANGLLTVEVMNKNTGKTSTLIAKYTKGQVAIPATKLAPGTYVITDFYIEDNKYGEYGFVDLPDYDEKDIYSTFIVKYPKLALNKIKTLSKKKSSVTLRLTLGDGKTISGTPVTFKFHTQTYKVYAKNGVAKVTIKQNVYKNFKVGKYVTYKATYYGKTLKYTLKIIK